MLRSDKGLSLFLRGGLVAKPLNEIVRIMLHYGFFPE
jgi:hypothetical protein